MKNLQDIFNDLLNTIEKNAINNEVKISNVDLFIKSWKSEIETHKLFQLYSLEKVNELIQKVSLEAFIYCGKTKKEWEKWWKERNKLNLNNKT